MCTVTYIPQEGNQYILTSNRDEQASRSPQNITKVAQKGVELIFPRDEGAGGTWIAVANTDRVVCLLNGAFDQHQRNPPYRKSRGIMVLEFFEYENTTQFLKKYEFQGMEPFTMIICEQGKLIEFRWDGEQVFVKELDTAAQHIWSSSTLYTPEIKEKRREWFAAWQKQNEQYDLKAIMDFHRNAGDGDPFNDVIMNRNGIVQTVSITNIIRKKTQIDLHYHDLLNQRLKTAKNELNRELVESI